MFTYEINDSNSILLHISEAVEAFYDVWLIGDTFMKDTIGSLHALKKASQARNRPSPFLFQEFNVRDYYAGAAYTGIARMLHAIVQAMNDNHRLAKYIIMIPDRDIVLSLLNQDIDSSYIMGATLHYLIKQINILIARRKHDLATKKPGVLNAEHPSVVWVRMLKQPIASGFTPALNKAIALRGKFNSVLEERLLDGYQDTHKIISIEVGPDGFDRNGNLTSNGKEDMWKEINRGMRKFDMGEIKLMPRAPSTGRKEKTKLRKLPTPPPKKEERRHLSRSCSPRNKRHGGREYDRRTSDKYDKHYYHH